MVMVEVENNGMGAVRGGSGDVGGDSRGGGKERIFVRRRRRPVRRLTRNSDLQELSRRHLEGGTGELHGQVKQ